jgi:F-type H+-transporting ATPase subunit alpha
VPLADDAVERRARFVERYRPRLRVSEQGLVTSTGDGIASVLGLPSAAMDEIVTFDGGCRGLIFHLGAERVGVILLEQSDRVTAGTPVRLTERRLEIPAGNALFGRVIDPLGTPLDGKPPPECLAKRELDVGSPSIAARDFVNVPLQTGVKMVDALIPIGRGQRQLIIGDNGTGKSALALDVVVNQKNTGVACVYVLIGQKRSSVVDTVETLARTGALAHSAVIVAEAASPPGLKYLAPFAGCAVAEHWMGEGRDTLVVYDDLTTHARSYRELSLLLRRPPGREAYPGDVFYLHSRLLERSTHLAAGHGGGSMTALPIVETEQGEIAAYVPTNLISITDGQIYLDRRLFAAGFRPAIDVTRSVSRVGGAAQLPRIKNEAGRMKLDYLQFLELEAFTHFGARLEASMEARIARGRILRESLEQPRLSPVSVEAQLAWLIAFNEGLLDGTALADVPAALARLERAAARTDLRLGDERGPWVDAVRRWLQEVPA